MDVIKNKCDFCEFEGQTSHGRYDVGVSSISGLLICTACKNGNWDGLQLHREEWLKNKIGEEAFNKLERHSNGLIKV